MQRPSKKLHMFIARKKNLYALRAVFELAKHVGQGPVKISDIAKAQAIPVRFLEVILGQLKGGGFVASKRGYYGGYFLVKPADEITVEDVLGYIQDRPHARNCLACESNDDCPFHGDCAFAPLWSRVDSAISDIYKATTIQDLINLQSKKGALKI